MTDDTDDLRFREAVPEDAGSLAKLARQTFSETFGHLYSAENLAAFLAGHTREAWHAELVDPRFSILLGEAAGKEPAAFAKLGPRSLPIETEGACIELRQFYLLKRWQGTGAAQHMMAWALDEARSRGADQIVLSVFIDNHRARRFYERHGFSAVGRYDFMVGSHADEDIIMRLDLNG